jgi:hypothetical protein
VTEADLGHEALKPAAIIGLRAAAALVIIDDHHAVAVPSQ